MIDHVMLSGMLSVIVLACFGVSAASAALPPAEALKALPSFDKWIAHPPLDLPFATAHPQGLIKIGSSFFLTTVDQSKEAGAIIRFQLSGDGAVSEILRTELKEGNRYHPGGMDLNPNSGKIWLPLAEYQRNSWSSLLEIDPDTLKFRKLTEMKDHIGTVVYDAPANIARLINWGTNGTYSVPLAVGGDCPPRLPKLPRGPGQTSGGYEYQDCKFIGSSMAICSGVRGLLFMNGVLDVIQFDDAHAPDGKVPFEIVRRVPVPSVERNGKSKPLTMNPMAYETVADAFGKPMLRLHFIPHDAPRSALYTYDVPLDVSAQ